jgi:hypothetical protein
VPAYCRFLKPIDINPTAPLRVACLEIVLFFHSSPESKELYMLGAKPETLQRLDVLRRFGIGIRQAFCDRIFGVSPRSPSLGSVFLSFFLSFVRSFVHGGMILSRGVIESPNDSCRASVVKDKGSLSTRCFCREPYHFALSGACAVFAA